VLHLKGTGSAVIYCSWSLLVGTTAWLTLSYAWANFSMLALGVWAVAQRDSTDAALMFLLGMIITMLTDAVHFGLYYTPPGSLPLKAVDTYRFSMATAISSLLLKPFSCFFIYREYRVRGGDTLIMFHFHAGISSASPNRESYQSIDPQTHPSATAGP
uniref:Angiotensin II receptor associated protein n=1 Tax=Scleropages formosus TaxID=113540 RepID=A0A8C9T287_SCLFO